MREWTRKWKTRKALLAAALVAVFAAAVFSASPEWVAWEGPLVIGSLLVQGPAPGALPRVDEPRQSEPMFAFLGFLSTAGILAVLGKLRRGKRSTPASSRGDSRSAEPLQHLEKMDREAPVDRHRVR